MIKNRQESPKRRKGDRLFAVPEYVYIGRVYVWAKSAEDALERYDHGAGFADFESCSDQTITIDAFEPDASEPELAVFNRAAREEHDAREKAWAKHEKEKAAWEVEKHE